MEPFGGTWARKADEISGENAGETQTAPHIPPWVSGVFLLSCAFVAGYAALSLFVMLAWDAFLSGTFKTPALSYTAACGLVFFLVLLVGGLAVLKDWGD